MLARAPRRYPCERRTTKTFPIARTYTPSSLGQRDSVTSYAGSERAADQRTPRRTARRSASGAPRGCDAPLASRLSAGLTALLTRRTSGQRGRRRWWTFRPGPGRCAEPAGPRFPAFTQRPAPSRGRRSADRTVATTGHPVRHSRPPRPAPRNQCAVPATPSRIDRVAAEGVAGLVVGRFTQAEPCRAGGYLARLWGGDGRVLRRQSGRTTLRPRSVSLFQESPGCPPGSGRP